MDEFHQRLANVDKIIKQPSEAKKQDLIFQGAVSVNPKYDMTEQVLKALNAQNDK